ncbi:MAG: hypothetical protein J7503_02495 [Cellulomonas iranensis]|uniref:Flp pilus assembly protein TadB n=1 Tax=Cellulomonas iranensis TaxID=76862 RepID=A0ABU0GNT6_9CELL|nr:MULTISPECIES: hypothetical protein [Cellulomonas]MBO9567669.1 hypothetical protein [Cellulomonas iranensis]MDQ0427016.1 Flp pilus assembly protein TadB [Cellulomonas iranensis]TFH69501.1 hypothetical protein E4A51_15735 [Cellulomonas sp. HD19AZ1]
MDAAQQSGSTVDVTQERRSRRATAAILLLAALAVVVAVSVLAEGGRPAVAVTFGVAGALGLAFAPRLWRRP